MYFKVTVYSLSLQHHYNFEKLVTAKLSKSEKLVYYDLSANATLCKYYTITFSNNILRYK